MKWKTLFEPRILERGYDYYLDNKVNIINESDTEIKAEVEGSETYFVSIAFQNDDIYYMECNCPYAEDGNYCKHMAAVLYQCLNDDDLMGNVCDRISGLDDLRQRINEEKTEIENLLKKISEIDKHQLLVKMLKNNSELKNSLKLKYDFQMDAKQMLVFKSEIRDIVSEHSIRGFVDWNSAYDFCSALENFLNNRVDVLMEKNCLLQAFELNNQVFKVIGTIAIDDSAGETGSVAEKCYENWLIIYQKANDDEKIKIREFFFKYKEGTLLDYIEEYLFEFRKDELATAEEIAEAISELDRQIAANSDSNDCGYIYSVVGGYISLIEKRVEYMNKLGVPKDEIDSFLRQNRQFFVVRNIEINKAVNNGEPEKAIALLIESKKLDQNRKDLLEKYSDRLIELYRNTGNIAGYIEELKYNLLNCAQTDTEFFKELKKNILDKEEWNALSDEIIEKNKGRNSVYAFLNEENRYDQMMDMLEASQNIFVMDKYAKILSKNVPDRVVNFYTEYVVSEMKRVSDRKHYRYLVKYLKTMSFCPNGKEKAKMIAEKWKTEYRRRTALMEELKKAGY